MHAIIHPCVRGEVERWAVTGEKEGETAGERQPERRGRPDRETG
jgi:hypothetical protein